MVSRYLEPNKYGGHTWHIKLDSLFHIFVYETNNDSFVVDFKEWKWVSYKTHFSFVSQGDMNETVIEAFDRVYSFFNQSSDYEWTESQKNNKLNEVLSALRPK